MRALVSGLRVSGSGLEFKVLVLVLVLGFRVNV